MASHKSADASLQAGDLFASAGIQLPTAPRPPGSRSKEEKASAAVLARRNESQILAFTPRDFVLCCLPLQQPAEHILGPDGKPVVEREVPRKNGRVQRFYKHTLSTSWVRRNGHTELRLTTDHPEVGLPFGEDLLTLIWLVTAFNAAGCPEDNILRFRSASDVLRSFRRELTGSAFLRLRESLERLMAVTVRITETSSDPRQMRTGRYGILRSIDAFIGHPNQTTLWQNVIEFDHGFARDMRENRIPIDWQSLLALASASRHLYVWEAWRSFRAREKGEKEVYIPVFKPGGLWEQLGSEVEDAGKRRQCIRKWHSDVLRVWPECPNTLMKDASALIVRPAEAVGDNSKLELPGVSRRPPVPLLSADQRAAMKPTLQLVRTDSDDQE